MLHLSNAEFGPPEGQRIPPPEGERIVPPEGQKINTQEGQDRTTAGSLFKELQEETNNPDEIVTEAPKGHFRLGYLDLTCLVLNHVMGKPRPVHSPVADPTWCRSKSLTVFALQGTGIFNSPGRVIAGTNSTGAALLLWLLGIVVGLCGVHVYVEYGLNVPRYVINGVEQTVPRSGGDLHYVSSRTLHRQ